MLSQLFFYELGGNDEIIGENCQMDSWGFMDFMRGVGGGGKLP